MSKVSITGNASGSGTFTIAAPNSNTDRTLTLPDEAGTVMTSATSAASIPGYGTLANADTWRVSTSFAVSGGASDITSNWTTTGGTIGSGMSQSSGVFTFPSTGIWLVTAGATFIGTGSSNYVGIIMSLSTDSGSNYSTLSYRYQVKVSSSDASIYESSLVDVTDISTYRIKFRTEVQSATNVSFGGNQYNEFHFIRLGDT
jgi:hypothetical protein